jgi:hypothetical protein
MQWGAIPVPQHRNKADELRKFDIRAFIQRVQDNVYTPELFQQFFEYTLKVTVARQGLPSGQVVLLIQYTEGVGRLGGELKDDPTEGRFYGIPVFGLEVEIKECDPG